MTRATAGADQSAPHESGVAISLPASAQRVHDALTAAGVESRIVELAVAARTSQQAADALGVVVGQIAKSLIFRATVSGRAVLAIAAGDRRVDEMRLGELLGEPVERATPEFVRLHAGFAIGGVAPIAHATSLVTFVDESLRRFDTVWAAGGTPHCVFPICPSDLIRISGGSEGRITT
jgi:prolyl-tRNA editing enzyme YbaK/EbsC (Cys-tRNA(Pro) deacylase)